MAHRTFFMVSPEYFAWMYLAQGLDPYLGASLHPVSLPVNVRLPQYPRRPSARGAAEVSPARERRVCERNTIPSGSGAAAQSLWYSMGYFKSAWCCDVPLRASRACPADRTSEARVRDAFRDTQRFAPPWEGDEFG